MKKKYIAFSMITIVLLSTSFAQFALVMMVGTLVTKLLRRGVMLMKMTQKRMMLSTHLMRRLRRKHLPRLSILMRVKKFICQCTSGLANSVLSMSVRLSLNLP